MRRSEGESLLVCLQEHKMAQSGQSICLKGGGEPLKSLNLG